MPREHIVSVRLGDKELAQLRVTADADGIPVSEVIRRLIRREHTPLLACGESVGCYTSLVETSPGVLSQTGITWCNGQFGGTLTIGDEAWADMPRR